MNEIEKTKYKKMKGRGERERERIFENSKRKKELK